MTLLIIALAGLGVWRMAAHQMELRQAVLQPVVLESSDSNRPEHSSTPIANPHQRSCRHRQYADNAERW